MGLAALVDAVSSHLGASLTAAPALLGAAVPAGSSDLPAVALEVNGAARQREGMGRVPGPTRTGALPVTATVELADPALHFPGDPPETVTLLTNGRRTLLLPWGTIVRADGLSDQPFSPSDLVVRRGNITFTPVAGPPGPTDVQLDPIAGTLGFASPLPNAGTVQLGRLRRDLGRDRRAVPQPARSRRVRRLRQRRRRPEPRRRRRARAGGVPATTGLRTVEPSDLGPIDLVATIAPGTRHRRLTYDVDFEHVEAVVRTSGGPIAQHRRQRRAAARRVRRRPSAPMTTGTTTEGNPP